MNENETQYYRMFKLDDDVVVEMDGNPIALNPGYYRFNYCLSGKEIEHKFQYSTNRIRWKDCGFCKSLYEFDTLNEKVNEKIENVMSFAKLEYVETIYYREKAIPIFYDDYGQCFFGIFESKEIGFGSFNSNYEDEIKDMIDYSESKKMKA